MKRSSQYGAYALVRVTDCQGDGCPICRSSMINMMVGNAMLVFDVCYEWNCNFGISKTNDNAV